MGGVAGRRGGRRSCVSQPRGRSGSELVKTEGGRGRPLFRRVRQGIHRPGWRLRQGRALRGSTCGSRPLTPAMPERLRGRLWQVATKRVEYEAEVREGEDAPKQRRMFIRLEPATGARAA